MYQPSISLASSSPSIFYPMAHLASVHWVHELRRCTWCINIMYSNRLNCRWGHLRHKPPTPPLYAGSDWNPSFRPQIKEARTWTRIYYQHNIGPLYYQHNVGPLRPHHKAVQPTLSKDVAHLLTIIISSQQPLSKPFQVSQPSYKQTTTVSSQACLIITRPHSLILSIYYTYNRHHHKL